MLPSPRPLCLSVLLAAVLAPLAAAQPADEVGRLVPVNGAELYVREHGDGEPLLLLHAFGGAGDNWAPYVPAFAERYRVIVPDLRGHGRSTNPDTTTAWRIDTAARDIVALLDALGLDRVRAVGGSVGAVLLLSAAALTPERFEAVVIVGGTPYRSPATRAWIDTYAPRPGAAPDSASVARHGAAKAARLDRQFRALASTYGDHHLTPDLLGRVTARALIVHGDDDALVPVELAWDMSRAIPGAQLWVVPGGGHVPYRDPLGADDFSRRVLAFLSGE